MKNRLIPSLLAAVLLAALPLTAHADLANFTKTQTYADTFFDVQESDWFYENVKAVNELGLMIGRSEIYFDTNSNMTVSEAFTIAARLHSIYHTGAGDFEQGEPWYQVYADYCGANGIADAAAYALNTPVTRAQFAEIFVNALPAEALEAINEVEDGAIPDVGMTLDCAEAVYRLYRAGILTGNDGKGTFAPESNIRRTEAAAIVTRLALPELRQSVTLTLADGTETAAEYTAEEDEEVEIEFEIEEEVEEIEIEIEEEVLEEEVLDEEDF